MLILVRELKIHLATAGWLLVFADSWGLFEVVLSEDIWLCVKNQGLKFSYRDRALIIGRCGLNPLHSP